MCSKCEGHVADIVVDGEDGSPSGCETFPDAGTTDSGSLKSIGTDSAWKSCEEGKKPLTSTSIVCLSR